MFSLKNKTLNPIENLKFDYNYQKFETSINLERLWVGKKNQVLSNKFKYHNLFMLKKCRYICIS